MLYVITVRILVRIYRTIVQYLLVVQSVVLCSAIEYSTRYSTVQYNTSMVGESEPSCYLQPHRLPAQVTSIKPQARATFHNSPATSHQPQTTSQKPKHNQQAGAQTHVCTDKPGLAHPLFTTTTTSITTSTTRQTRHGTTRRPLATLHPQLLRCNVQAIYSTFSSA